MGGRAVCVDLEMVFGGGRRRGSFFGRYFGVKAFCYM